MAATVNVHSNSGWIAALKRLSIQPERTEAHVGI
jgi:hypothetical protein